jgi:hypothetical protein
MGLQRVGRQHPVDGAVHASGNAWSEVLGQGPAVADAAGLTVMLVWWVVAIGVLLKHRTPAARQA